MRSGKRACKNRKCDKCSCSLRPSMGARCARPYNGRMPDPRLDPQPLLPDPKLAGTVIVGMSGRVDSAAAALLLQRAGYAVQGLFMSNWEEDDDAYCTTA